MNKPVVEVLLVLALFITPDEEKSLAFLVEIVEDAEDMSVGTRPEFLEVLDRTALQGIRVRPTELGAELLKEKDLREKRPLSIWVLRAELFKVLIGGSNVPHTI